MVKTPASTAGGVGSIPGPGTKILRAAWCGQKKIGSTIRLKIRVTGDSRSSPIFLPYPVNPLDLV